MIKKTNSDITTLNTLLESLILSRNKGQIKCSNILLFLHFVF